MIYFIRSFWVAIHSPVVCDPDSRGWESAQFWNPTVTYNPDHIHCEDSSVVCSLEVTGGRNGGGTVKLWRREVSPLALRPRSCLAQRFRIRVWLPCPMYLILPQTSQSTQAIFLSPQTSLRVPTVGKHTAVNSTTNLSWQHCTILSLSTLPVNRRTPPRPFGTTSFSFESGRHRRTSPLLPCLPVRFTFTLRRTDVLPVLGTSFAQTFRKTFVG